MPKHVHATVNGTIPVTISLTPDQVISYMSDILTEVDTERLFNLLKSRIVMGLTGRYTDINRLYINDDGDVCYRDYHEYKSLTQLSDEAKAAYRRLDLALKEVSMYMHDK